MFVFLFLLVYIIKIAAIKNELINIFVNQPRLDQIISHYTSRHDPFGSPHPTKIIKTS